MAILIKAPRKARARRSVKSLDMAHVGFLPQWNTIESCESDSFQNALNEALRHYGYFSNVKDLKSSVTKWLVNRDFGKDVIRAYKKSLDWRTPMTVCSLAAAYEAGMPEYPRATEFITDAVMHAISFGNERSEDEEVELNTAKKAVKKPSIQDRITDKVNQHILHFEEAFEDGIIERKEKHPAPDVKTYLNAEGVPPSMITRIVAHFQAQWDEIAGSQGVNADEQLAEGYAHLKRADVKRFTDFYKALIVDLEMYKAEKKATVAPRRRKVQPKTKIVANLKYMKTHEVLKLVSVDPTTIVDATTLWVYNTKTRKIGVYHATDFNTLTVKSTTIAGFNKSTSIAKTLRKPAAQLAEFKKAGKVKLRTFMDSIKAVDIKLTGRLNADTILLKVL